MGNQVLIIEDDKEIRTMLASFLEQRGYLVWVAAEGLEATAKLKERQYDLILMDLMRRCSDLQVKNAEKFFLTFLKSVLLLILKIKNNR